MSSDGRSVGTGLKKLYGSIRVNGKPSRSKSVSNLQTLFTPPTEEELNGKNIDDLEIDEAELEKEKENMVRKSMELGARRKSMDISRVKDLKVLAAALDTSTSS